MTKSEMRCELYAYFLRTRQVGHTSAMLKAIEIQDCILLFSTHVAADAALGPHTGNVIVLAQLEKLRGIRKPLLIDNSALMELFSDSPPKKPSMRTIKIK